MKSGPDASLTLYIQNESPGKDGKTNWLPASKDEFKLALRLYALRRKSPTARGRRRQLRKMS